MGPVPPARGDQFASSALEKPAGDRDEARIAQIGFDQVARQVPPAHALKNEFLLHQLIADGPASRALDQKIIRRRQMARGVADYALHVIAHLLRRDRRRNGKAQEVRRDHRYMLDDKQIDEFEPRIALVDVVKDEVRLVLEQTLPGS